MLSYCQKVHHDPSSRCPKIDGLKAEASSFKLYLEYISQVILSVGVLICILPVSINLDRPINRLKEAKNVYKIVTF